MIPSTHRQIRLASRPTGYPSASDFRIVEAPVPEPGPGELLVRVVYLSVDPYMRGRMSDARSYVPPVALGDVMEGGTVGEVVRSSHPAIRRRRRRGRPARLAGVRGVGRQGGPQDRSDGRADLDRAGRARDARAHRVLRAAGSGAAQGRRDCRRLGGVGSRRRHRRPDREAQGMPGGGPGRLRRQGRLPVPGARIRRRDQLPDGARTSTRRSAPRAPAGSTSTSTTWAAGSPRRCRATSTSSRGSRSAASSPSTT